MMISMASNTRHLPTQLHTFTRQNGSLPLLYNDFTLKNAYLMAKSYAANYCSLVELRPVATYTQEHHELPA